MINSSAELPGNAEGGNNIIVGLSTQLNEFLKKFQNDGNVEILARFPEALLNFESSILIETKEKLMSSENEADSVIDVINKLISLITSSITFAQFSLESQCFYNETIVLLSLIKEKFLKEEDLIEYTNNAGNSINFGMKLIKDCIAKEFYSKAEYYIEKCRNAIKWMNSKYICRDVPIMKTIKDNHTILELFRLEIMLRCGSPDITSEILKFKTRLQDFSFHYEYFIRICHNAGVSLAKRELFDEAISVTETAKEVQKYSIFSNQDAISIHSLLAAIYLKYFPEKHWKQCLESLKSASEVEPRPVFFINMLRVAFYSNEEEVLRDVLCRIRELEHVGIEFALGVIDELRQNECNKEVIEFCHEVRSKVTSTADKLVIIKEEMSLHFMTESFDSISSLLNDVISMSNNNTLDAQAVCRLCQIVAKNAVRVFDSGRHDQCLSWYKKCCQLTQQQSNQEISYYFQQRICLCYVEMRDGDCAKEAFGRIRDRRKDSMNVYLALNIAFMIKDKDLAETALQWVGDDPQSERVLLSCCRRAFECGHQGEFLCTLLEEILGRGCSSWRLSARIIQCLIRMHLRTSENEENKEKILAYLEKGQDTMKNISQCEESQWFSRISWNLGLSSTSDEERFRFMLHSCLFLKGYRGAHATLMTVAAGIELMRTTCEEELKMHVFGQLSSLLDSANLDGIEQHPPEIRKHFLLYAFETHLLGGASSTAERLLGTLMRAQYVDPGTLKNAAVIAYEVNRMHKLVPAALKGAIAKVLAATPLDCSLLSKLHSFLLQEYVTPSTAEETLKTLGEIAKLLENDSILQDYPEIEVLWMSVRSWNVGVRLLSSGQSLKGRPWCELGLRLVRRLPPPLRALHEKKMTVVCAAHFGEEGEPPSATAD